MYLYLKESFSEINFSVKYFACNLFKAFALFEDYQARTVCNKTKVINFFFSVSICF